MDHDQAGPESLSPEYPWQAFVVEGVSSSPLHLNMQNLEIFANRGPDIIFFIQLVDKGRLIEATPCIPVMAAPGWTGTPWS